MKTYEDLKPIMNGAVLGEKLTIAKMFKGDNNEMLLCFYKIDSHCEEKDVKPFVNDNTIPICSLCFTKKHGFNVLRLWLDFVEEEFDKLNGEEKNEP